MAREPMTYATRRFQFPLSALFLATAAVAVVLQLGERWFVEFLVYLICNVIACAVIFGVPIWLASYPDR